MMLEYTSSFFAKKEKRMYESINLIDYGVVN